MISTVAPHTRCVDWNCNIEQIAECVVRSHLTRGAWIEIFSYDVLRVCHISRTSHEVRGLKFQKLSHFFAFFICRTSHEVRGLKSFENLAYTIPNIVAPHTRCVDWNKPCSAKSHKPILSHLTRGAWIEMVSSLEKNSAYYCRTSHEVRGLKLCGRCSRQYKFRSHLTRGAWIEITGDRNHYSSKGGRTSHEVRGLKWYGIRYAWPMGVSHLTRGAWEEFWCVNGSISWFAS